MEKNELEGAVAKSIEFEAGYTPNPTQKVYPFPAQDQIDIQAAKDTAQRLNIPFVDPMQIQIDPNALSMLSPEAALRRQALPIKLANNTLLVALLEPDQPVAVRSLELLTGCNIRSAIAPKNSLSKALDKYYRRGKDDDALNASAIGVANPEINAAKAGAGDTREKSSFNISVISNKGGVGKTHFSINTAYTLANTRSKVLLIDTDLGNSDISNKLGIFPKYSLMDFLTKQKQLQQIIYATEFGFDFIGGLYGEFKLANLHHAQKTKFINHFNNISRKYDFVIFDLGAGISRTVLDFALAADKTVIVTTPQDIISGYACIKAAFYRFKEIEEKLHRSISDYKRQWVFSPMTIINQVDDSRQGSKLYQAIMRTIDENIGIAEDRFVINPEYLGAIPYDKQHLRLAEVRKKPLLSVAPNTKASQSIRHISKRFCSDEKNYSPDFKYANRLRRFAAVLSQKQ